MLDNLAAGRVPVAEFPSPGNQRGLPGGLGAVINHDLSDNACGGLWITAWGGGISCGRTGGVSE